jgi:hypothetical protein
MKHPPKRRGGFYKAAPSGVNSQIGQNDLKSGEPASPRTETFAYEERQ